MTRKSKARYGLKRTYRVNPTVKALRAALMAGLLASASTVALAAPPPVDIAIEYFEAGDITVVNPSTDLYAEAIYAAGGIVAISDYGDVDITNDGNITADAGYYYGYNALAAGIYAEAGYDATVANTGDIDANAYGSYGGPARALGIYAVSGAYVGDGDTSVQNGGAITTASYSSQSSQSVGIAAYAEYGDVTVANTGVIVSTATVYAEEYFTIGEAVGITAVSGSGDVDVVNSGLINVAAYVYDQAENYVATASVIGIDASGYSVSIDNTGSIAAFAANDVYMGNSIAIGITAEAYADISISNTGDITLSGSSGDGYYYASLGYPNYIRYTGDFVATGISAESTIGSISVTNSGDISITDLNEGGIAGGSQSGDKFIGITAKTLLGDSSISNSGDVSITGGEEVYGIVATTDQLTTYYDCPPPYDNGYYVCYNRYGGGNATVVNSGDIALSIGVEQEYDFSFGVGIIAGTGKYGGNATVSNSGDITVINSAGGDAVGIIARSSGKYSLGSSIVSNSGDITVSASYSATGIGAYSTNDSSIYNSGDITVTTEEARARALYAVTDMVAYISNSGDLSVVGGIGAIGAGAAGAYGATTINTGDISVTSTVYETGVNYYGEDYYLGGWAYGAFASSRFFGVATVINTGDIEVNGITRGTGLSANSRFGSTYIYNTGDLTVSGKLEFAYGINSTGSGQEEFYYGDTGFSTIINEGDITVTSEAFATGIQVKQTYGNIQIYNSGDISATIVDSPGYGNAFGLVGLNALGDVDIINVGDITVASGGNAGGIVADSAGYDGYYYSFPADVMVQSDGALSVTSEYGRASGITASSQYGSVTVEADGSIDVNAYNRAFGVNAVSNYGDVEITSSADINVSSSNYNAIGLRGLSEYYDVVISNAGTIDVQAETLAQGIVALSYYGSVEVVNEGDVTASSSSGYSQAIAVRSYYGSQIVNLGTITAGSDSDAVAISVTGGGSDIINYGDISGAMIADEGDDYVYNGEDGRIFLTDDTIDLAGGYNYFLNEGKVYADGMNNVINMGYAYSGGEGEGGYYYGVFVNNGSSIHMNDGAADDSLTIIGDFSGSGDLDVDVDGASLTSDTLYIYGNVLTGTSNTVNIDLLSLPSAADLNAGATIPIVEVSGSSSATDFVLGDVNVSAGSLFTADYSLVYDGSEFALGFDITGLSTAGVLLTSASPAIQNMWYGSLGTMYQRQGGERQFLKNSGAADVHGAAGAWTRIYGSDGSITPSANRNNFGDAGSQDFSFGNDGIEFGVGYSFTEAWTAGLLGGLAKGTYRPDAGGRGELTANTIGGYVTFTPGNGFYADLSYRDFSLDGETNGGGASLPLSGDASGYSLELGYGFKTKSGLEIEPQLQYSSVDVSLDNVGYNAGDFKLTDGDSDMFRAGVALRKSYEQNDGIWTPYTALSYVDVTSASNEYLIGGVLQGGVDMTGGSVLFELGTDAKYGDLLFNLGVSVQDGGPYEFVYGGQLNIRYTF